MKTIKLKHLLIPSLIFFGQQAFGQIPGIDSLKIIPENPNLSSEVKVICYATFPSGGCELQDHDITIQGNQITLNVEYMPGAATYICHAEDTISLGNLSAGDYHLHTNLIIQPLDEIVDTATADFTVANFLRVGENTFPDLAIYPNPFEQELQIQTDAVIEKIEIHSLSGQLILLKEGNLVSGKTVDLSHLEDGAYLIQLTDSKGNTCTKRILKRAL